MPISIVLSKRQVLLGSAISRHPSAVMATGRFGLTGLNGFGIKVQPCNPDGPHGQSPLPGVAASAGPLYELALEYRFKAVRHSRREATIIKTDAAAKCPSNGHGFDVA
jgi:hypothetical protein